MKAKRMFIIELAVLSLFTFSGVAAAQDTFFDPLTGDINSNNWTAGATENVGEVNATESGVELTMFPNNSGSASLGGASLTFACEFSGDFDAQYDFELVDWPTRNGIRLGLGAGGIGPAAVERVSGDQVVIVGNREVYLTHFPNGIRGIKDTTDTEGTLRMSRVGNLLRGYYWSNGAWVLMNTSAVSPADPSGIGASVWGHYRTPGITARVTNFSMVADEINCPVTEVLIDIKPDSAENPVNVRSKGVIPVAVLSTDDFDATSIANETVAFGPGGAAPVHGGHIEDIDGDGYPDMLLHFSMQESDITCSDEDAMLTGETLDGMAIEGMDIVLPKGCK